MSDNVDYPFIRLWGTLMAENDKKIKQHITQAREDKAPDNAIFKSHTGAWWTFDDIEREDTKTILLRWKNGHPETWRN
jgi:hypothetical protein